MNEEYSDMFSELSGHSGGNKYKSMAHVLFSFAGWTYEKWMDQQYTDHEWKSQVNFSLPVLEPLLRVENPKAKFHNSIIELPIQIETWIPDKKKEWRPYERNSNGRGWWVCLWGRGA